MNNIGETEMNKVMRKIWDLFLVFFAKKNVKRFLKISLSVLFGIIFSVLLIYIPVFQPSYIQGVFGMYTQFTDYIVISMCQLFFGVFICLSIFWFFSKEEKDSVPLFIIIGAALSLFVGSVLIHLLTSFSVIRDLLRSYIFTQSVTVFFLILGGWLAGFIEMRIHKNRKSIFIITVIGIIFLVMPLLVVKSKDFSFPNNADAVKRAAWAEKKMPLQFLMAQEYLKKDQAIAADVGSILSITPKSYAINRLVNLPGGVAVELTLAVKGEESEGYCFIAFVVPKESEVLDEESLYLSWVFNGEEKILAGENVQKAVEQKIIDEAEHVESKE